MSGISADEQRLASIRDWDRWTEEELEYLGDESDEGYAERALNRAADYWLRESDHDSTWVKWKVVLALVRRSGRENADILVWGAYMDWIRYPSLPSEVSQRFVPQLRAALDMDPEHPYAHALLASDPNWEPDFVKRVGQLFIAYAQTPGNRFVLTIILGGHFPEPLKKWAANEMRTTLPFKETRLGTLSDYLNGSLLHEDRHLLMLAAKHGGSAQG